ncbi:hypothetical protein N9408_08515 [Opitutales bacterium]|nr:hypothetical protein [Opitutales bacterium]
MNLTNLVIALLVLCLCNCSTEETELVPKIRNIEGDVFIVMQSAQNIKLGLVEVYAVENKHVQKHLDKGLMEAKIKIGDSFNYQQALTYSKEAEALFEDFQSEYEKCIDSVKVVQIRHEKMLEVGDWFLLEHKKYQDYEAEKATKPGDGFIYKQPLRDYKSAIEKMHQTWKGFNEKVDYADKLIKKNYDRFIEISALESLFEENYSEFIDEIKEEENLTAVFSNQLQIDINDGGYHSEKTDADGKFQISLDEDKNYTLFATANRKTLDSQEYYYWLVELNPLDEKIFLSNDNMNTYNRELLEAIKYEDLQAEMDKIKSQSWYGIEIPELNYSKVEIPELRLPDLDN